MAQGAFGPQFVEQLLGLDKHLFAAHRTAKKPSPRTRNLLFSKQSDTSSVQPATVAPLSTRAGQPEPIFSNSSAIARIV